MNNKLIFLFGIIFLLGIVSAGVNFDEDYGTYGGYKITSFFPTWLGGGGTSNYNLLDNTASVINCMANLEVYNELPHNLIDDINFIGKNGEDLSDYILSLRFEIGTYQDVEKTNYSAPIYSEEQTCEDIFLNETNTTEQNCYFALIGYETYTEEELVWKEYTGEEVVGYAQLKILAERSPLKKIDWIITFRGEDLVEWAWWDSDWNYKREINLTANVGNFSYITTINYSDNMQSDFDDLRFVDCASETTEYNYTRQAFVNATNSTFRIDTNGQSCVMMYYGNPTATSTSSPSNTYFNPVSYWTFDEISGGVAVDLVNGQNFTLGSGMTQGQTGIISNSVNGDYTSNAIGTGTNYADYNVGGELTISMWLNLANSNPADMMIKGTTGTTEREYFVRSYNNGLYFIFYNDGWREYSDYDYFLGEYGNFVYVTMTYNDASNNITFYKNGVQVSSFATTYSLVPNSLTLKLCGDTALPCNGDIDELGIWKDTLTSTQIYELYTQTAPTYIVGDEQLSAGTISIDYVTPPTPENGSNLSTPYIPVEVEINYTNATLDNITYNFYKGGVLNASYFYDNETLFVNHTGCTCANWQFNVTACYTEDIGLTSSCVTTETRTVLIDILPPTINITSPLTHYDYLYDNQTIDLNFTVEDDIAGVDSCWVGYQHQSQSGSKRLVGTHYKIGDGFTNANITISLLGGTNNLGVYNIPDTCIVDNLISLRGNNTNVYCVGDGTNYSIVSVDAHLGVSAVFYDEINCSGNETFQYNSNVNSLTVYANDTFGNVGNLTRSWYPIVTQQDIYYENETYEGENNLFQNQVLINGTLTNAYMNYAGTNYTSSIIDVGDTTILYNYLTIPDISIETNNTFYWYLLVDDIWTTSIENNQTVYPITITNCSKGTLLNLTLLDEKTQTSINGTIEVLFNIISSTNLTVETFNQSFNNTQQVNFCTSLNESEFNLFKLDGQIKYYSDNYSSELYNIQNSNLTNFPTSIYLYDILTEESTTFKITYKGDDFIIKEGVLVQLLRKYISEDSYKVVEAPITNSLGEVVLHVDLDSNIYNIIVSKDGEVLDTYENIVFICDNQLASLCTFKLDGVINPYSSIALEELRDITYSISQINDSYAMVVFSTSSGTPANVNLFVEATTITGQSTVYNNTVYTSAGSFLVPIDSNTSLGIGNNVYDFQISKDDEVIGLKQLLLNNNGIEWDNNNYFIVVLLLLSLVFMAVSSPEFVIFNAILTFVLAGGLWLVNGMNFVVGLGNLIWLVIAGGILIYKLANQEDR